MADERVVIAVDADTSGATTELQDLRRSGERAAREIGDAFRASSKEIQRDFGKIQSGLEKVFGGVVGDVMDVSDALDELGLVAGTAAGAMLAGGGIVYALYEAAKASGSLDDSTSKLTEAWLDLRDGIGKYAAPAFNVVINAMTKITTSLKYAMLPIEGMRVMFVELAGEGKFAMDILSRQVARYGDILDALSEGNIKKAVLASQAHEQATLGMIRAHEVMPGAVKKAEDAMYSLWKTLQASEQTTHGSSKTTKGHTSALLDEAAAARKAAEAAAHYARIQQEFDDSFNETVDGEIAKKIQALAEVDAARAESYARAHDQAIELAFAEAQAAAQSRAVWQSALGDIAWTAVSSTRSIADSIATQSEAAYDTAVRLAEEARAYSDKLAEEGATAAAYYADLAATTAEDSAERLRSEAQKSAMAAYVIQQAAAAAQIAIDAIALGSQLAVALVPSLGPAAPIAAAGIAAASAAANAAALAAVPPPQVAHTGLAIGQPGPVAGSQGLAPDEVMVRARRGEEIVPRGRREEEPSVVVVSQYGHRLLDAVEGDRARMRTSPYRQLAMRGAVPGHRRR